MVLVGFAESVENIAKTAGLVAHRLEHVRNFALPPLGLRRHTEPFSAL